MGADINDQIKSSAVVSGDSLSNFITGRGDYKASLLHYKCRRFIPWCGREDFKEG
jgi:hypothetical protein